MEVEWGMARLQCHWEGTRGRLAGKAISMQRCLPRRENRAKLAGRDCLPQLSTRAGCSCSSNNRKFRLTWPRGRKRRSLVFPVAQPDPTSCRRREPCRNLRSSKSQPPREMVSALSVASERIC